MISQSLVKSLETTCPRKAFEDIKKGPAPPGSPMEKGAYFETLSLGVGAGGQQVFSLPTLKSGQKSIDQIRIEEQVLRFKEMFPLIVTPQLHLKAGNYEGTIDFVANGILYDLKLTENLDGYWSEPSELDLIQQVFYRWLYKENFGYFPEVRVVIFEYGPRKRVKEIKINVSEEATLNALARFKDVEDQVAEWESLDEWPRIPAEKDCSKCRLVCPLRIIQDKVIYEEITI